jgi:hypothetical protein
MTFSFYCSSADAILWEDWAQKHGYDKAQDLWLTYIYYFYIGEILLNHTITKAQTIYKIMEICYPEKTPLACNGQSPLLYNYSHQCLAIQIDDTIQQIDKFIILLSEYETIEKYICIRKLDPSRFVDGLQDMFQDVLQVLDESESTIICYFHNSAQLRDWQNETIKYVEKPSLTKRYFVRN